MAQSDTAIEEFVAARRRVLFAFALLAMVLGIGSAGYMYLGWAQDQGWTFGECLYMTAITITTVGFAEVLDIESVAGGREWTLVLLVFGISANLYVVSSITSFFVESDFAHVRRYRVVQRRMKQISGHYIVCGVGTTGSHVVRELLAVGEQVVAVDTDPVHLSAVELDGALTTQGDATDDEVLERVGLSRAKGVVSSLDDDKTNMFVVVSARQSNPRLRIVAKAITPSAAAKLKRAGADAVVAPALIGGMRMASELVRPQVVRFLDDMLRDRDARLRIEEAVVSHDGPSVGKTLAAANLREETGVLVLAYRSTDGEVSHAPPAELRIEPGQTLIAIGRPEQIRALRRAVGHPTHATTGAQAPEAR